MDRANGPSTQSRLLCLNYLLSLHLRHRPAHLHSLRPHFHLTPTTIVVLSSSPSLLPSNLVAAKVMRRDVLLENLRVEGPVDLLLRLHHPHIVKFEGWCMDLRRYTSFSNIVLAVMCSARLKATPFTTVLQLPPPSSVKYWIAELLDALDYLQIWHCASRRQT